MHNELQPEIAYNVPAYVALAKPMSRMAGARMGGAHHAML